MIGKRIPFKNKNLKERYRFLRKNGIRTNGEYITRESLRPKIDTNFNLKDNFFATKCNNKIEEIFSKPKPEELKKWAQNTIEALQKLREKKIDIQAIKTFSEQTKEIKELILKYITLRVQCPVSPLRLDRGYGYYFPPIQIEDIQNDPNFREKIGLNTDEYNNFIEILKDQICGEVIKYRDKNNQNPLFPSAIRNNADRTYFKGGDPFYGPFANANITGVGKNSVLYLNPMISISHSSDSPVLHFAAYNSDALCIIESAIQEAQERNISTIAMPIGVYDRGLMPGGHAIALMFNIKDGKITGFTFNNTNRMLSRYSFYFYYFPILKTCYNSLHPELQNIVDGIKNVFEGHSQKPFSPYTLRKMLYSKEFTSEMEKFYNFQLDGRYKNYDLNLKIQGKSGFCLKGSSDVTKAMATVASKLGYPKKGILRERKKDTADFHREPENNFNLEIRKNIDRAYVTKFHSKKYSTYSDLQIIYNMCKKFIEQKCKLAELTINEKQHESTEVYQKTGQKTGQIKERAKFPYPTKRCNPINYATKLPKVYEKGSPSSTKPQYSLARSKITSSPQNINLEIS